MKDKIHLYDPKVEWNDYSGRFAAGAALAVQVDNYLIANIHGMWQGSIKEDTEAKLAQSKQIIEFVEFFDGKKIICGDFNLLPNKYQIDRYV